RVEAAVAVEAQLDSLDRDRRAQLEAQRGRAGLGRIERRRALDGDAEERGQRAEVGDREMEVPVADLRPRREPARPFEIEADPVDRVAAHRDLAARAEM